jgi:hypothetical protein
MLIVVLLASCYEDKGNYNYKKLNEIEISGVDENSYSMHYGDVLKISPKLNFKLDQVPNLKYKWLLDMKQLIGEEKDLNFLIPDTLANYSSILFCIEDVDTGYTTQRSISLNVTSQFHSGWLVLSEREGKSRIDFFNRVAVYPEEEGGDITYDFKEYYNIFKESEGRDLGSNPILLHEHWREGNNDPGHVYVVQNGNDCVDLFGNNLKESIKGSEEFLTVPVNYNPKDVLFAQNYSYILNDDGRIFGRRNFVKNAYNTGRFSDYPIGFKEGDTFTELNVDRFVRDFQYGETKFVLVYEKVNKRFLAISDFIHYAELNTVGKIIDLYSDSYNPKDIPLHNTGDNDLIFTGCFDSQSYSCTSLYNIYRTADGSIVDQVMDVNINQYSATVDFSFSKLKQRAFPDGYIDENTIIDVPDCSSGYGSTNIFFAKGNTIYYYSRITDNVVITEYYTFDSEVVAMDDENWNNKSMCVGLANGEILLMDISNQALSDSSVSKVLNKSSQNLGDIKHVMFKSGRP